MVQRVARQQGSGRARTGWGWSLWSRWVLANALGETVGLGATALVGVGLVLSLGEASGLAVLALAAGMVLAGTLIEGVSVGTAQWLVLRRPLPALGWRAWTLATAAGAFVAWTLGMVPSTALSLGAESGGPPAAGPSPAVVYALAALMGLVLGPVLGVPQWFVLRRHLRRAFVWVPANALAWAPAMVVVFVGVEVVVSGGGFGTGAFVAGALTLAAAGAVVGAIHGLALLWLLRLGGGYPPPPGKLPQG
jgi:hypothetical protein